jgi:hypothetical protein
LISDYGVRRSHALLVVIAALVAFLAFAAKAWAAPPANDSFSNAVAIGADEFISGTNHEATKEPGEPNHAGDPGGHSVWYSWTATKSGGTGVRIPCNFGFEPAFESLVAIYTGASVDALVPVASNGGRQQPLCPAPFEPPEVEFEAEAGVTYRIAIDGKAGDQGAFSFALRSVPVNDDFANATTIPAEPLQQVIGTTKFATRQVGELDHADEPGGHSVWFKWTPTSSGPVDISTCSFASDLDTVLAVYTGNAVDALSPVASNDDSINRSGNLGCAPTDSGVRIDAHAGTTYRIAVDGAAETSGNFNLRIAGRPANDSFSHPEVISSTLPANPTGWTELRLATKEPGEPDHAGNSGGHSVWYSWTPSSSGVVGITACGQGVEALDTVLAVYTGNAVDALTPVASAAGGAEGCGPSGSEVQFDASAGTSYRIAVDAKDGEEGELSLSLSPPPANDDFADAQVLSATPGFVPAGSTTFATSEPGEPDHAGDSGGHSVWYSWMPSQGETVAITACGFIPSGADPVVAVYTGNAVDALTPIGADDGGSAECGSHGSEVELSVAAGTTYMIAIDAKRGAGGLFSLSRIARPVNDDLSSAQSLSSGLVPVSGSTRFASKQLGEPDHAGDPGGHSVWYSWTATENGPVDIAACGRSGGIDTLLAVYTGSAVNALTPVVSNDDALGGVAPSVSCQTPKGPSEVQLDAVAGTTYAIAVDAKEGEEGPFSLSFEHGATAPENDAFADAEPLADARFGAVDTRLATKESGEPDHAGDPGGHSVWYSWTATNSEPVWISTCSSDTHLDTLLAVYTGSALADLTPVASSDNFSPRLGCQSTDSAVEFTALAGTTYEIAVDGKGGTVGRSELGVQGKPANDEFGKPRSLGSFLVTGESSSNRLATLQAGEPEHAGVLGGRSVWFKWTAPRNGEVTVDTCGSDFDTTLAVYTGAKIDALTQVAGNDDGPTDCAPQSRVTFAAAAGTVYRIAVDGKAGAEGDVELGVEGQPSTGDPGQPSPGGGGGDDDSPGVGQSQPTQQPSASPQPAQGSTLGSRPRPKPKPLHCKAGFEKIRKHGKARCVKKPGRHASAGKHREHGR